MRDQLETLRDLVAKHCDVGLSDEEREILNDLLRLSPALRREYSSLMDVHASLLMLPEISRTGRHTRILKKPSVQWAAAAVAASVAVLLIFSSDRREKPDSHFATLIRATECQWQDDDGFVEGELLGASTLRLKEGVALIRFLDGVEISLSAPSHLEIDGPSSARLREGELYFSNEMGESGATFSLSTPQGTLLDIGTRYSVAIGPDGTEEIHVGDGKVVRQDKRYREVTIGSGQAMRWLKRGDGEVVPFVGKSISQRISAPGASQGIPLAHYSFVEREGSGFAEDWSLWGDLTKSATLEAAFTEKGLQPAERTVIAAPLDVPIDMSQNEVTYFSFVCFSERTSANPKNFYFSFRESENPDHKAQLVVTPRRLTVGAHLIFGDNDSAGRSTMALALPSVGSSFQLVGKIVSRAADPDQLFLRILPEHEPLDSKEPYAWTVVGQQVDCDFRLDLLSLHMNVESSFAVSEVVLGTTWESVTNPSPHR